MCVERFFDVFARRGPSRMLERGFLSVKDIAATPPWSSLLAENTPGELPREIPVFIAQGTTDDLVRPSVTRDYVKRLCAAGSPVETRWLPGVGHLFAARDSAEAAIAWIADRFDGLAAPTTCGRE
jgi:acetyl esterase/lipase